MVSENFIPIIILVVFAMLWNECLDFLAREYGFFTMLTISVIVLMFELMIYFLI